MKTYEIEAEDGRIFEVEVEEPEANKSERSLKQDIPGIASEFVSGALADAPRNIPRNPLTAAIGGPSLVQMKQGFNIPTNLMNLIKPSAQKPLPFPDESRQLPQILPEPKTDLGKVLGAGANILGGTFGQPGQAFMKGTGMLAEGAASKLAGPAKVKQIQEAFFPFQKAGTERFGQAIKTGTQAFKKSGIPVVVKGEVEAIFSPIANAAKEAGIPNKAKQVAENIDNFGVDDLLKKKAVLRRTLSVAERTGKLITDRSRIINQTIKNIDSSIRSRIPGIEKANQEYAIFSRIKEMMEKFEPGLKNLPDPLGTKEGERVLRSVLNMTGEEINLLKMFENATNIKIVGPAKASANIKKLTNIAGKLALYGTAIYAMGRTGIGKEMRQAVDVAN